ncbi:MAG TPA: flagellar transcriptional regulator FlhD [Burkholderiales bacterium]|nr:flagellar transcriptional regulator FlhD [Burkholderiales bacterium]
MHTEQISNEIRETNLSYLMLAQHMIRTDREQALYRLGLSEEVADAIERLTTGQIMRIAATNMLMCRFRFDDQLVWSLLGGKSGRSNEVSGVHAAILMAGSPAMSAAAA